MSGKCIEKRFKIISSQKGKSLKKILKPFYPLPETFNFNDQLKANLFRVESDC